MTISLLEKLELILEDVQHMFHIGCSSSSTYLTKDGTLDVQDDLRLAYKIVDLFLLLHLSSAIPRRHVNR